MLHDDHIHLRTHTKPPPPHELSGIITSAAEKGIAPAIREHAPLPRDYCIGQYKDFDYGMIRGEEERFISLFEGTGMRAGFEVDYFPGYEDETAEIISTMTGMAAAAGVAISGINGSVHLLPGDLDDLGVDKGKIKDIIWDLDEELFRAHITMRGIKKVLDEYFGRMSDLVATGMYDTLSHIELIRKFDRRDTGGESIYFRDVEDFYLKRATKILEQVSQTGMAVELNMAGMFNNFGRPYLGEPLLRACAELNIPVCLASDTHKPEGIGANFDIAVEMCRKAGLKQLSYIEDRKVIQYDY